MVQLAEVHAYELGQLIVSSFWLSSAELNPPKKRSITETKVRVVSNMMSQLSSTTSIKHRSMLIRRSHTKDDVITHSFC